MNSWIFDGIIDVYIIDGLERLYALLHSKHSRCLISFFPFSIIFNIPHFFELKTEMKLMNETHFNESIGENITLVVLKPQVAPTELRDNLDYSRDYVLIANSVALVFIPILTLIILNSFIFRTISQATRRHNEISSQQRRDNSVRTKPSGKLRQLTPSFGSILTVRLKKIYF